MKVIAIPAEIWSRVVGFYRPVRDFNLGKKEEFKMRAVLSNIDIERAVNNDERSDNA